MKRKRSAFRKGFLLSGILILSVLFLGQLGWACDEPDYNDYLCYEKLDITKVNVGGDKIIIRGQHFDNGAFPPTVTLGSETLPIYREEPYAPSGELIVAHLPDYISPGHYKL